MKTTKKNDNEIDNWIYLVFIPSLSSLLSAVLIVVDDAKPNTIINGNIIDTIIMTKFYVMVMIMSLWDIFIWNQSIISYLANENDKVFIFDVNGKDDATKKKKLIDLTRKFNVSGVISWYWILLLKKRIVIKKKTKNNSIKHIQVGRKPD